MTRVTRDMDDPAYDWDKLRRDMRLMTRILAPLAIGVNLFLGWYQIHLGHWPASIPSFIVAPMVAVSWALGEKMADRGRQ